MEININFNSLKKILKEKGMAEEIWNKGKFWSFKNHPLKTNIRKNNDDKITIQFTYHNWNCDVVFKKKKNTDITEMHPTIYYNSLLLWALISWLGILGMDIYEYGLSSLLQSPLILFIEYLFLAFVVAFFIKLTEIIGYFCGVRGNISRKLTKYIEENYDTRYVGENYDEVLVKKRTKP